MGVYDGSVCGSGVLWSTRRGCLLLLGRHRRMEGSEGDNSSELIP
jgi:hypothetical protein